MKKFLLPAGTAKLLADLAHEQQPRNLRFNCPVCGYRDAFSLRWRPARTPLLTCFGLGCPRPDLYAAINKMTGGNWVAPKGPSAAKLAAREARKQRLALDLFVESVPVSGTIGETYLASRKVEHLANSEALGFHPNVTHPQGCRLPALVALVVDVTDRPIGIHRTYLATDGAGKACVTPQKATLGPVSGGVIKLEKLRPGLPLIIGEGLETSASAGIYLKAPAWSAISAGNLGAVMLPPEVADVIIAVDPDPPGHKAAALAGQRWRGEGRKVRWVYTDGSGDFNDILCASPAEADNG